MPPTPTRSPSIPLTLNPEVFLALLELMYETGLRRSDAIVFEPDLIRPTTLGGFEYTTEMRKTGDSVTVYPPAWLVEKLRALPRLDAQGRYPFYDGKGNEQSYLTAYLNKPLRELGTSLCIFGLRPHRFRDSFAVNCLNARVTMDELQRYLGHKSRATTERYYNAFVDSRKEALERTMMAARLGLLVPALPEAAPVSVQ